MSRVNVLFLTHRLPYAPNRGDRVRAYFLLRELRRHADVTLVSLVHDEDEASHASSLRDLVSSTYVVRVPAWRNRIRSFAALPTQRPTTHTMLDAPGAGVPTLTVAAWTSSSSGKCVNTCLTTPGRRRQSGRARRRRGACSIAVAASKSCRQSVVGTSAIPPSNPFGGRERNSTKPSARTTT